MLTRNGFGSNARVDAFGLPDYSGTSGADMIVGTRSAETFDFSQGGKDFGRGAGGSDEFYFGAAFDSTDRVNGGRGYDQVFLNGDYSTGLTLRSVNLVNVESLILEGDSTYRITLPETLRLSDTQDLFAIGGDYRSEGHLSIDGSRLTNVGLYLRGGGGDDVLVGGAKDDRIYGGLGNDFFEGGAGSDLFDVVGPDATGADIFYFRSGSGQDTIGTFDTASDVIQIDVPGVASMDDLTFASRGSSVVVSWTGGASVTIESFFVGGHGFLTSDNFRFGAPEAARSYPINPESMVHSITHSVIDHMLV